MSRITLLETETKRADEDEDTSARYLSQAEVDAATRDTASDVVSEHSAFDAALKDAVAESIREVVNADAAEAEPPATAPVEPAAATAPEPLETPTETPVAEPETPAAAPTTPDVEALRPLVNRLIREELQGEIGERITRNVRKLVRQEIQRALSMQDLD